MLEDSHIPQIPAWLNPKDPQPDQRLYIFGSVDQGPVCSFANPHAIAEISAAVILLAEQNRNIRDFAHDGIPQPAPASQG